jgi:hypothetical protein
VCHARNIPDESELEGQAMTPVQPVIESKSVEFVLRRLLLVLGLPESTPLRALGPLCQALVWAEAARTQERGLAL